MTFFVMWPR